MLNIMFGHYKKAIKDMRLEISLFKFDCKSDYLPYYKKYFLKIENEKTLLDVLETMNKDEKFGFENDLNFGIVLNGLYTDLSITLEEIKKDFGTDLVIEPLSIRRSYDDLLIDTKDFEEKINVLDFIIDEEDKREYASYKNLYYASNTLNYEKDYIGDAALLLAHSLIAKHNASQNKILKAIDCCHTGINFHTSLENRIYNYNTRNEDKINSLKTKVNNHKVTTDSNFRIKNTYIIDFGDFQKEEEIKHDFNNFNIAYYQGNNSCDNTNSLLNKLNAKVLNLSSMNNDLAIKSFNENREFTYRLAADVLLDAFDNSVDLLVVDNDDAFYLFDYNRKELERISGREIILPIIHVNELQKLAYGLHDEVKTTLERHIVNPELI